MSEMKKIPQRSEIAQEDKWAIEDLYATDEAWSADLEKLKTMTQELAAYAGHLAENPAKLLAYLEETKVPWLRGCRFPWPSTASAKVRSASANRL